MRTAALAALALLVGSLGCGGDPEAKGSSVTLPPVMVAPVEAHHVVEQIPVDHGRNHVFAKINARRLGLAVG